MAVEHRYAFTIYVQSQAPPTMPASFISDLTAITNNGLSNITIRLQYKWRQIEQTQGVYTWQYVDAIINQLLAVPNVNVMFVLQDAPTFRLSIDGNGNPVTPGTGIYPSGTDMATYAGLVAARYGDTLESYQIGNEEWDTTNPRIGTPLAAVVAAAYPAIRAHSTRPIGMCAVRKLPDGSDSITHITTWMTNVLSTLAGLGGTVDWADFHAYFQGRSVGPDPTVGSSLTPTVSQEIGLIYAVIQTYMPSTRIRCMETGWGTTFYGASGVTNPVTPDQQRQYIIAMHDALRNAHNTQNCDMVGVYTIDIPQGTPVIGTPGDQDNIVGVPSYGGISAPNTFTDLQAYYLAHPSWVTGAIPLTSQGIIRGRDGIVTIRGR